MKRLLSLSLFFISFGVFAQTPVAVSDFELYGDHIFIKLSVDGSEPLDFILDTGDGLTVIDIDVAKKLNLNLDQKQSKTSAQGSITGSLIKHNNVKLGDLTLEKNISIYATSLSHLEISIGRNVDGIIGYDFLHHHIARLNFDDNKIEVYEGVYPQNGTEVRFKLYNFIPTISATVELNNGEKLDSNFFVNTGAGTSLDFNTPFANANKIIDKTGDHYSYLVKGLGDKETKHYEGRVKKFSIGSFGFENMPIGISQVETGIQSNKKTAGIIGSRVLRKFNILFDYRAHKMYFEKSGHYDKPFNVNCSGLDVQMSKDMKKVLVHQIIKGGPAEKAGIKENAEITKVNGKSAKSLTLIEIEDILKRSGEKIDLTLNQGGKEKKVSLNLKSLL